MQNIDTSDENFLVGVSIVVVPDGLVRQKGLPRVRVSLSLSPTRAHAPDSVATIDIRSWPQQIAQIARRIRLHIQGREETRTCDADVDLLRFQAGANRLWRRIFSDGAGGIDQGFRALLLSLGQREQTDFQKKAPVISSPTAETARLIDAISGSALAATLLQRAATRALAGEQGNHGFDRASLRDASSPGVEWWRMIRDEWLTRPALEVFNGYGGPLSEGSDLQMLRAEGNSAWSKFPTTVYANSDEPSESAADPMKFFMSQIGAPEFWRSGETNGTKPALGAATVHKFLKAQARQQGTDFSRRDPIVSVADTGQPSAAEVKLASAASRKYAGLLCFPTLAKYVGLILDTDVDADFLTQVPRVARSYGKLAATFAANDGATTGSASSPPATGTGAKGPKNTHATEIPTSPFIARIEANPQDHVWTCFIVRRSADLKQYEYFGPQERGETQQKPGHDGLLPLAEGGAGADSRFELITLDVTNAAEKILQIAKDSDPGQTLEATRSLPELLTRGIMLVDKHSKQEEDRRQARLRERLESKSARELFAEDLVVGYRIDVVLTKKVDEKRTSRHEHARWRTLVARSLNYGRDVDRQFLLHDAIKRQRVRDDGCVRPMIRQDEAEYRKVAHPELFTWTGESLAVPHVDELQIKPQQKGNRKVVSYSGIPLAPADLTVDLIYDLPAKEEETYRKPPPLRENRGYMFGARVLLLNGCCLDFHEATNRYVSMEEGLVLGAGPHDPFVYRRRAKVHAPDVLLLWNDRIVTSTTSQLPHVVPGETIFDLVVRSGKMQTATASRLVIPPRVTFDLAEQAGLFDNSARPKAAFVGKIRVQMDHALGVFPIARSGSLKFPGITPAIDPCEPQGTRKTPQPSKEDESRGAVLVLDAQAARSNVDFYADPMARQVGLCFVKDGVVAPPLYPGTHRTEFWPTNVDSSEARPVVLRLKKGRRGDNKNFLGWFDREDSFVDLQQRNSTDAVRLRQVTVVLVPGASVDLELFSIPYCKDPADKHHAVANAISLLRNIHETGKLVNISAFGLSDHHADHFVKTIQALISEDNSVGDKSCEDLLSQGALSQLTTKRIVKVVHAVDRPPAPRFVTTSGGRPRFFPISITVKRGAQASATVDPRQSGPQTESSKKTREVGENPSTNIEKSWDAYVTRQETWEGSVKDGKLVKATLNEHCEPLAIGAEISADRINRPRLERACWDSEEGGLTTFFVGEVLIDRLTTGRLRCEAKWSEYSPAMIRQDGVGGKWIASAPDRYARLFELSDIEAQPAPHFDPAAPKADQQHLDTLDLLRKISNNLRYLAYPFIDGRARHLRLQLIATSRFSDYFPKGTPIESSTEDLRHSKTMAWVPCTFRPAPPEIDHILPVFHWTNEVHDSGLEIRWRRESSLRVFMGRNWFSSGEGETLGLVCWPNNLLGSNKLEEDRAAPEIRRRGMTPLDPPSEIASNGQQNTKVNVGESQATAAASFRRYGQFVTRWGADPIHLSGSLDDLISADRFEAFDQTVNKNALNGNLILSLPDTNSDTGPRSEALAVCVVTYPPKLDSSEGIWYSDITIDHGASYFPFIQLGLVRYQAHAVGGLELSYPVAAFAQIPPRRQGLVKFVNEYECDCELSGIGFHRSETGAVINEKVREHDDERFKTDVPALDIKLMSAAEPGFTPANGDRINWQPVLNSSRKAVEWLDERPVQRGAEVVWRRRVRLPMSRWKRRYALLIEEYEYMAAEVVVQDPKTFDRPSFTTQIVRRGPVFSHIVDLGVPCDGPQLI
jgi:hypothetical protein